MKRHLDRIRKRKQAENDRLTEFRRKKSKSAKELLAVAKQEAGSEAADRRLKFYKKVFERDDDMSVKSRKRPREEAHPSASK